VDKELHKYSYFSAKGYWTHQQETAISGLFCSLKKDNQSNLEQFPCQQAQGSGRESYL
jgi:hypothetical protein